MQFLEPVLHVAPPAVDVVNRLGRGRQVGHHEARIVLGVAARMPHHLGLDDHAAFVRPAARGVARLPVDVRGLAGRFGQHPGLAVAWALGGPASENGSLRQGPAVTREAPSRANVAYALEEDGLRFQTLSSITG
jgi:hypothetical protein